MKCYDCGVKVLTKAVRVWREAKNGREKAQMRDVCEPCYDGGMRRAGYILSGLSWKRDV